MKTSSPQQLPKRADDRVKAMIGIFMPLQFYHEMEYSYIVKRRIEPEEMRRRRRNPFSENWFLMVLAMCDAGRQRRQCTMRDFTYIFSISKDIHTNRLGRRSAVLRIILPLNFDF